MKKLFSKQDPQYETFVGKTYTVCTFNLVVEHVIAEGGFSFVFFVRDTNTNEHYALKRMLVNSRADLENCTQEIEIMKQFHKHPSVASLKAHNSKHIGNGIYEVLMLMKHYKKGTVVDKMNDNLDTGFSEVEILTIMQSVTDAVSAIHTAEVLHRDLKVENILIGERDQYVLCDFGSAMRGSMDPERDGHSKVEENINRFTTLSYRAPEMIDLYSGMKISSPADVWALGVLLYKLCFFTTPFEENTLAIARAKYTIPPTSKYSDHIHNLIRDILKPDPSARPTAQEIMGMLKISKPAQSTPAQSTPAQSTPAQSTPAQSTPTQPVNTAAAVNVQRPVVTAVRLTSVKREPRSVSPVLSKPNVPVPQLEQVPTSVKSRQRPRGKHILTDTPLIIPPTPANNQQPNLQKNVSVPRPTPPPSPLSPRSPLASTIAPPVSAGQSTQEAKQGQIERSEVRSQRHSVALCEGFDKDPWGQQVQHATSPPRTITRQRPAPQLQPQLQHQLQPQLQHQLQPQLQPRQLPTLRSQPSLLLPPPPASPSHHMSNKFRRTHNRAKSDTTFLRNFNPSNPFLNDAESANLLNPAIQSFNKYPNLSTSLGHLVQDSASSSVSSQASFSSCERIAHTQLLSSSSSNVEQSIESGAGSPWSDTFDPEDEFTKLSLRETKIARAHIPLNEAKPVARAHTEKEGGLWLEGGKSKVDSGGVEEVDYNDFLRSPPTSPSASKKDRTKPGTDSEMAQDSAKKKKKKGLQLFGRKKESEPDPLSHFNIVSNPLHGHFEQS